MNNIFFQNEDRFSFLRGFFSVFGFYRESRIKTIKKNIEREQKMHLDRDSLSSDFRAVYTDIYKSYNDIKEKELTECL